MAQFVSGSVLTASNLNAAINGPTINAQTSSYTLGTADYGKLVTVNTSAAGTVTITTSLSTATAGVAIGLAQIGTGQLTVTAGSAVTLQSYGTATKLVGQYATAQLLNLSSNTWLLFGNITA